jgi:glycosyltransferase involved in cell wall biosynthesis
LSKILFIEYNLRRLGGGSKAAISIADILKGFGHEIRIHNLEHLDSLFPLEDLPKYFPCPNLEHELKEIMTETKEEGHYDLQEVVRTSYELTPQLEANLQWADYVVNSADFLHKTIIERYPGKLINYLHVAPLYVMEPILRDVKYAIANSKHTYKETKFACGDDLPLELVYPPINPDMYDNSKPLKDRDIDLLFCGRIAPDKLNTFDFEILDWQIAAKKYKALFVGSGWATGYNPKTEIQFKRNATFAEVRDAQQNAKIYIHTKPTEDFGQVITEAMAAGCVVMVPDPSYSAFEFDNVVFYHGTEDLCFKILKIMRQLDKYDDSKIRRRSEAQVMYDEAYDKLRELFP